MEESAVVVEIRAPPGLEQPGSQPASQSHHAPCPLPRLPPELLSIVVRSLARTACTRPQRAAALRTLASTSTAMLTDILECAHTNHFRFVIHPSLARCVSRLSWPASSTQPSSVALHARLLPPLLSTTWQVSLPLHVAARVCGEHLHSVRARRAAALQQELPVVPLGIYVALFACFLSALAFAVPLPLWRRWILAGCVGIISGALYYLFLQFYRHYGFLCRAWRRVCAASRAAGTRGAFSIPEDALPTVTAVSQLPAPKRRVSRGMLTPFEAGGALPENMTALASITLADKDAAHYLPPGWLPASSAASVRTLQATRSHLRAVPPGMRSLERVEVSGCALDTLAWLPISSRACVTRLVASHTPLRDVPPHLPRLTYLDVEHCDFSAEGLRLQWLPASSASKLRCLLASDNYVRALPGGMSHLCVVDVSNCGLLARDWLPLTSRESVRAIIMDSKPESVRRCPEGMQHTLFPPDGPARERVVALAMAPQ